MHVSLPESLRGFVAERMAGRFGNASEYIRHLIREDQKRAGEEKLEALLLEGLESGDPEVWAQGDWLELKREVQARILEKGRENPRR